MSLWINQTDYWNDSRTFERTFEYECYKKYHFSAEQVIPLTNYFNKMSAANKKFYIHKTKGKSLFLSIIIRVIIITVVITVVVTVPIVV